MSVKKVHSGEEKEPYNSVNRTNKTVEELSQNGQREQKNTLTRRSPRKVVKKKRTTESLRTDSLVKEDCSKIPKRSAHNRKHSN